MFAVVVNLCDRPKQQTVASLLLNLMLYDADQQTVSLVWGSTSEKWTAWYNRGLRSAAELRRFAASLVRSRRIVLGGNRPGAVWHEGQAAGVSDIGSEVTVKVDRSISAAALSVDRRAGAGMLWLGWYRDVGVDVVMVHRKRRALMAATGRCGCLFDEQLQLWLVERNKSFVYSVGSHQIFRVAHAE